MLYFYSRSDEHATMNTLVLFFIEDFMEAHLGAIFTAPNGTLSTFLPPSPFRGKRKSFAVDFSSNIIHARSKLAAHHVGIKGSMKSRLDFLQDESRGSASDDFFCFFFCLLPFQSFAAFGEIENEKHQHGFKFPKLTGGG